MIFNLTSGGGSKGPFLPVFDGVYNFVSSPDGLSGYIELMSSGTLTWADGRPKKVDMFCVGGGAGGANATSATIDYYTWRLGGGGGGSGYTTTVTDVTIPESISVIIGAGGSANSSGGTTSIGELCVANGGSSGTSPGSDHKFSFSRCVGGNGGSAGGNGGASYNLYASGPNGADAGSNGGDPMHGGASSVFVYGVSQGTPTTDLLGRVHAGGGGGAPSAYTITETDYWGQTSTIIVHGGAGVGGKSDFTNGKGGDTVSSSYRGNAYGGGGYGGGGAGQCGYGGGAPAAGGQGFAMIAWGDYLALV